MSKRLFTAIAGVALGVLASTAADARPHEYGHYASRSYDRSYSAYDGSRKRYTTRSTRRHAGQRSGKGYTSKRGQSRKHARSNSSFMRTSAGTSRGCLTSATRALLGRIEGRFGKVQIISTCRPGARIAGSGRPSKHASGQAVDFNAGSRKAAVVRWLIANHKSGGTMTYSGMSHIHVDVGHRFVSLGARSRG